MQRVGTFFQLMVIVFLLGVVTADAGDNVSYGIKGGINWARASFDDPAYINNRAKTGFTAGLFTNTRLTPNSNFSFQLEIVYSQKGQRESVIVRDFWNPDDVDTIDFKVCVNYLEIPVLLKFNIFKNNRLNPHLILGFAPAITVYMKSVIENAQPGQPSYSIEDYRGYDFGFVVGTGIDYRIMNKLLSIEIRKFSLAFHLLCPHNKQK